MPFPSSPLWKLTLAFASCSVSNANAQTERLCQSPDCLVVENHHSINGLVKSIGVLDTRLHLYIFVPPGTDSFKLGIFDQNDDNLNALASKFELYAPSGVLERSLESPQPSAWADYSVTTVGKWGIWRLSVTGPQDLEAEKGKKTEKARNAFMIRTLGAVDL
ncbi:hypothetical protein EON80_20695, partial [bacterium]